MAEAEPGSLMPVLEHRLVHLLWLFAQRSLTKSFPLLAARSGIGVGLLCPHTWLAQLLCLSLPLSQVHKYFDTATVLSPFSCFGAHPASRQEPLLLRSSTEELLALALFPAGRKSCKNQEPFGWPILGGEGCGYEKLAGRGRCSGHHPWCCLHHFSWMHC